MSDEVEWFPWREVQPALAFGRRGGIALHYFRYDLRRFGLRIDSPCCHVLSADRDRLIAFAERFGLPPFLIKPPRSHRPDVWHFDAFGWVLDDLIAAYPPPDTIDEAGLLGEAGRSLD